MPKIYLSPSDQYNNKYSYGDYTEAEVCRWIAEKAKSALLRNGFQVKLASKSLDINARILDSNNWGADAHICIHTNAGGGDGTLVLTWSDSMNNGIVKGVYDAVASLTPTSDDGIRAGDSLAEVNSTRALCVYIECEFHDNSTYAAWIVNHIADLGEAICKGVCDGYNRDYNEGTYAPETPKYGNLYKVQIGAYKNEDNANAAAKRLVNAGYTAYVYVDNGFYKVQAGSFAEKENATKIAEELKNKGFNVYVYEV